MLENWCWTHSELTSLSSHYETGEKIPKEMVDTIISTKHVNDALFNLRQLHFGFFDMEMHSFDSHEKAVEAQPSVRYNKLRTEITLLDPPQGLGDVWPHHPAPHISLTNVTLGLWPRGSDIWAPYGWI
jgi:metallopeptidase MepB